MKSVNYLVNLSVKEKSNPYREIYLAYWSLVYWSIKFAEREIHDGIDEAVRLEHIQEQ